MFFVASHSLISDEAVGLLQSKDSVKRLVLMDPGTLVKWTDVENGVFGIEKHVKQRQ